MALPNVQNIRSLRGWLCKDPTDLNLPFPHGGTALGIVKDGVFKPGIRTRLLTAEEWGDIPVEGVYSGESSVIACLLREFDTDAMTSVFPNFDGAKVKNYPNTQREVRPGFLASERQITLLFSPRDLDQGGQFIVLYKALPLVQETMQLQLMLSTEATMAAMFQGIPDNAGRTYEMGLRADITL